MTAHNAATMQDLQQKLKTIATVCDLNNGFVYLDYPFTNNVGDLLINIGTELLFAQYGIRPEQRYSVEDAPMKLSDIDEDVTFLMHAEDTLGISGPVTQVCGNGSSYSFRAIVS